MGLLWGYFTRDWDRPIYLRDNSRVPEIIRQCIPNRAVGHKELIVVLLLLLLANHILSQGLTQSAPNLVYHF